MDQLLTPEQKAKAAENRKKAGAKMKATSDARLEKMKANLGLKDEQVAQFKAQQAQTKAQMKAIHDDQSLTADAKKAQVKALMQKQKESWKTILTPEQLEKLKSSHKAKGQEAK
jgi:Spy/CpxP family protein refolding chaperone